MAAPRGAVGRCRLPAVSAHGKGRRRPPNLDHVESHPFGAVAPHTVAVAERTLTLPSWHWTHDQGQQGSCVGHGSAMERAIRNGAQARAEKLPSPGRRYDPLHIWNEAKRIDPFPDTNPGDQNGTTVSAAYDVLRDIGPRRCLVRFDAARQVPVPYSEKPPSPADGVAANRWATTVDEIRTAIQGGSPVAIGVDWYEQFDTPVQHPDGDWYIPAPKGSTGDGHCVCLYGASDRRQAFKVKNSWGRSYPLAWLPYTTMSKLLAAHGEACIATDR